MSDNKGLRVREFFDIEARTLMERYRVLETLLPNPLTRGAAHRGEEGRHIESLLRDFLNRHLPSNLRALTGFVICPATKTGTSDTDRVLEQEDRHSGQIDIIVYDVDAFPIYERFEEFCIVPPEGVVGVLSVKKTLYNQDIATELSALRKAVELCMERDRRAPFSALVAFAAQENDHDRLGERTFDALGATMTGADFSAAVNEVSVLGRLCVFKVRREDAGQTDVARYVGVDCRTEGHIPLQRLLQSLLSVYYDPSRASPHKRPGFVSFRRRTFRDAPTLGHVPVRPEARP